MTIRTKAAIVGSLLLILAMILILGSPDLFPSATPPPHHEMTDAERQWIKARHKYHGITMSIIENGEHYFIRAGHRCRL